MMQWNSDYSSALKEAAGLFDGADPETVLEPPSEYLRGISEVLASMFPVKGMFTGNRALEIREEIRERVQNETKRLNYRLKTLEHLCSVAFTVTSPLNFPDADDFLFGLEDRLEELRGLSESEIREAFEILETVETE